MKTLFEREFKEHSIINIHNNVAEGCEWVLTGEGIATRKLDGTCCMIKDGKLYSRFDMKPGRKIPDGAIPCQNEADSLTGHFPHWIPVTEESQFKWHRRAFDKLEIKEDGTYELIGKHFMGNPEKVKDEDVDILVKHGSIILKNVPRTFEGIKKYLEENEIEGIVFHRGNGDMCKIKRTDFGFSWNRKTSKH